MATDPSRRVVSHRFPYLPIRASEGGRNLQAMALLDTGFEGGLALPHSEVPVGLIADAHVPWQLADGSLRVAPTYWAMLRIGELDPIRIRATILGSEIVVGREVSDRYRVLLDRGWQVVVE